MESSKVDPTEHGFVFLESFNPPWGVRYYERGGNHAVVDGSHDFHRLNVYLSQDSGFVNIWFGSLDARAIDSLFREAGVADEVEATTYDEPLFRGYLESAEQAEVILHALRLESFSPQTLRNDTEKGIVCELLDEPRVKPHVRVDPLNLEEGIPAEEVFARLAEMSKQFRDKG